MSSDGDNKLPTSAKPSFLDYLETFLPFRIPRIPLPKVARSLDRAGARLIEGKSLQIKATMDRRRHEEDARSKAKVDLVKAGTAAAVRKIEAGDATLEDRAIAAVVAEAVTDQQNREKIFEFAAKDLEADPPKVDSEREIDEDWLGQFSRLAATKSKEDIQSLWGKLLASEIRKPGSFSLRTLNLLSMITPEEAQFIHSKFKLVLANSGIAKQDGHLSFDEKTRLEHIGVITPEPFANIKISIVAGKSFHVFFKGHVLKVNSTKDVEVSIDAVALSPFGRDLYGLANPDGPPRDYVVGIAKNFKNKGCSCKFVALGAQTAPEEWLILSEVDI